MVGGSDGFRERKDITVRVRRWPQDGLGLPRFFKQAADSAFKRRMLMTYAADINSRWPRKKDMGSACAYRVTGVWCILVRGTQTTMDSLSVASGLMIMPIRYLACSRTPFTRTVPAKRNDV